MNLIAAHATRDGAHAVLTSPVLREGLALDIPLHVPLPSGIDVGFRAHDAELCATADADLRGRVAVVEALGPATLLHIQPEGATASLVRVLAPPETCVAVGETAGLRIRRDRIHLFDSATGARLH